MSVWADLDELLEGDVVEGLLGALGGSLGALGRLSGSSWGLLERLLGSSWAPGGSGRFF